MITASAPSSLMLSIGYAVLYGHPTVVATADKRIYVSVEKNSKPRLCLVDKKNKLSFQKPLSQISDANLTLGCEYVENMCRIFFSDHDLNSGLSININSEIPTGIGLGSSSAITAALAKALFSEFEIPHTNYDLFDLCYKTVIATKGVGSGFDLASAIWGGTLYYKAPASVVDTIPINSLPLLVAYTGKKANTPSFIKKINSKKDKDSKKYFALFEKIGILADKIRQDLLAEDLELIGEDLRTSQKLAEKLGVSTQRIEEITTAVEAAGAFGASCNGSGGGDCLLIATDKKHEPAVRDVLEKLSAPIISVKLNSEGVRIEKN